MEHRIISRAEWGARYRGGWFKRPLPAVTAWLHKPVVPGHVDASATFDQDAAYLRRLEQIGYDRFGPHTGTAWGKPGDADPLIGAGISYTFLVQRSGRIFAGHDLDRQSSHTAGHNFGGIGIAWEDGPTFADPPTLEQINATSWLLRHLADDGTITAPGFTGGHRDVYPTDCPTDVAYDFIPTVNALAPEGAPMSQRAANHTDMLAIEKSLRAPSASATIWRAVVAAFCSDQSATPTPASPNRVTTARDDRTAINVLCTPFKQASCGEARRRTPRNAIPV